MPAKSKAQFRFFKALAHSPRLRKKLGMSEYTAKEYTDSNYGDMAYSKLPSRKKALKKYLEN